MYFEFNNLVIDKDTLTDTMLSNLFNSLQLLFFKAHLTNASFIPPK